MLLSLKSHTQRDPKATMTLTELLPEYLTSSSPTHLLLIAVPPLLVLYTIYVVIYRLYLGPLASIPGPRLAALTQWYEFYYDIILPGQYTFKICELHKEYGPIIRINPWEVHISDPDFHRELLPAGTNRRRDRTHFWCDQFGAPGLFSLFPLSHMFSWRILMSVHDGNSR